MMTSKEIIERYFINEKANINETAETCYRMACTYPTKEKIEQAREKYDQVKNDLDRLEKLEKVIEILKTKKVDINLILSTNNYNEYISFLDPWEEQIKEEEYELLREVLEDVKD